MPPVATLIQGYGDLGDPPEIVDADEGMTARQTWWVNTHKEDEALSAANLPVRGQAYSPAYPLLVCTRRRAKYRGGRNNPATGVNGVTVIEVEYATPGGGGTLPTPSDGQKWSSLSWSASSQTIRYDVRGAPYDLPIDNGNGTSKEVGVIEAEIVSYRTPAGFNPYALMPWKDKVNSDAFILPNLWNSGVGMAVPVGGARYRGFGTPELVNGLLRVSHRFALADGGPPGLGGHDEIWGLENRLGKVIGSVPTQKYARIPFVGMPL